MQRLLSVDYADRSLFRYPYTTLAISLLGVEEEVLINVRKQLTPMADLKLMELCEKYDSLSAKDLLIELHQAKRRCKSYNAGTAILNMNKFS